MSSARAMSMSESSNIWYRLGYALESARPEASVGRLRSLAERRVEGLRTRRTEDDRARRTKDDRPDRTKDERPERPEPGGDGVDVTTGPLEVAFAAATGTIVARLLGAWPGRGQPGPGRLIRAAVAGAGAALVREVSARFLGSTLDLTEWRDALPERMAAGSARGLLYAAILEPRVPGPPLVRAALYGWAEHALTPLGGLRSLLGRHAPYRALPLVGEVLEDAHAGEDALVDHLVFALALGLLYGDGDGDPRMGMGDAAE